MKIKLLAALLALALAPAAFAQAGGSAASSQDELKAVLAQMNKAAASFKSAHAEFEWIQYEKAVDEKEIQKGQIYFKRTSSGMDAALRVVSPDLKKVVFKDGKLSFYQPKIDQLTVYEATSNRTDVESFMSLGFGARGDDLLKNYEVAMKGWETVDGVKTARLELVPKSEKMKSNIERITLWIDPARSVSLQQQFFAPGGDYRLTHYTDIQLNVKLADDVFRIKTTSKTTVVKPH